MVAFIKAELTRFKLFHLLWDSFCIFWSLRASHVIYKVCLNLWIVLQNKVLQYKYTLLLPLPTTINIECSCCLLMQFTSLFTLDTYYWAAACLSRFKTNPYIWRYVTASLHDTFRIDKGKHTCWVTVYKLNDNVMYYIW